MRMKALALAALLPVMATAADALRIQVGRKLPDVEVRDGGQLVPRIRVAEGRMILDGKDIAYRPWQSTEGLGRVRTIYHLAARMGIDDVNKPFIDALIAAHLPEFTPDGAYKTITVLDLADALWGTAGLGRSRLEGSQRDVPHAIHVLDGKGVARTTWGLGPKQSTVIVLDRDNTVLFFKEGKLGPDEIRRALGIIKERLGMK